MNFKKLEDSDPHLIMTGGWSGPYADPISFDQTAVGKPGEVRYNSSTDEYVVWSDNGWVKAPGYDMYIQPGSELRNMYDWFMKKRLEEEKEAALLAKHPELQDYKDQYEFMKKMVADNDTDKSA